MTNPTIPHGTKEQDMSEELETTLRRLSNVGFGYDLSDDDKAALVRAAETISAWNQRAKPVVKALEWGDSGFDQSWAKTPFGEVSVQDYSNRAGWTMDICGEDLGEKPTRNEAKRHVEREVARRVHACLEGYDD